MRSLFRVGLLALTTVLPLGPAESEPLSSTQVLERLFRQDTIEESHFTESFLAQVSLSQIQQIIDGIKRDWGTLTRVEAVGADDAGFALRFAEAEVPAQIALDEAGRITGIWFGSARAFGQMDSLAAAVAALPGQTSLLVQTDGGTVIAHNAEKPLAVGSAAKLAILVAVKQAVAEGRLDWAQVVELAPRWQSLPSGILQDWPAGTPLTLATLAQLMISISDNTATDALIDLAGRRAVEAVAPRNAPFLTTRELFLLKGKDRAAMREDWEQADEATRREILRSLAKAPRPLLSNLETAPTVAVEWFLTARELCGFLEAVADLPAVGINPGLASPNDWRAVAYKGGSETGVLNYSTRLVGHDGRVHCVVASWNDDKPLRDQKMIGLYRGILTHLAADAEVQ